MTGPERITAAAGNPGLPRAGRGGLLLAAGVALMAGLAGALLLLGLPMPAGTGRLAAGHGLLMTLGFLGTLVALERAVALGQRWAYAAPLASGLGGLLLVAGADSALAAIPLTLGAAILMWIYADVARVHPTLHGAVQAAGAVAWFIAGLLLREGGSVASVTPLLAAFLVFTVLGERLELSALVRPSAGARRIFVAAACVFGAGVALSVLLPDPGVRVAGIGLAGMAAWGARFDLARRTIHARGVTRFIAACLLAGYGWLAVGGLSWMAAGSTRAGAGYDASLHAVFLGFAISMVFGHAPVILPGVLRLPLPYHPIFYGHLALLHAGLLLRIVGGDILQLDGAWRAGGVLNVAALVAFVLLSAGAAVRGTLARQARPRNQPTVEGPTP